MNDERETLGCEGPAVRMVKPYYTPNKPTLTWDGQPAPVPAPVASVEVSVKPLPAEFWKLVNEWASAHPSPMGRQDIGWALTLCVNEFVQQHVKQQPAPAVPAVPAVPDFDSLPDEVIDAACAKGGLYRVDFMRAWEEVRARLSAAPKPGADGAIGPSLLRQPVRNIMEISKTIPGGCCCTPGTCQAPVIMGMQTPCLRTTEGKQEGGAA